jgi:hypothetical protein
MQGWYNALLSAVLVNTDSGRADQVLVFLSSFTLDCLTEKPRAILQDSASDNNPRAKHYSSAPPHQNNTRALWPCDTTEQSRC